MNVWVHLIKYAFFSSTHWIGGWMDHRASLDAVAKGKIKSLCRKSNSGRSAPGLVAILTGLSRE